MLKPGKNTVLFAAPFCLAGLLLGLFFPGERAPADFGKARRILQEKVWFDHQVTLYCGAVYDNGKNIELPAGFTAPTHLARAEKMEWEHAVPAENFGRAFREWREGDPICVKEGKPFRGRKCAARASSEYREMEADMYNLFPSIGAVNAARGNRQYADLPDAPFNFGSCAARVQGKYFDPPARARGQVARAALYMDRQYGRYSLSRKQKRLFEAWNREYPVDKWECIRARRIEKIQGNENIFIKKPCQDAGLW